MIKTFRKLEIEGNFLNLIKLILQLIMKDEMLSPKVQKQDKDTYILIQHTTGSSRYCNKARKGNKRHTDQKEKNRSICR